MCGRFTLRAAPEAVAEEFGVDVPPDLAPRYNVAPGQTVAVVREEGGGRRFGQFVWGLVPHWARERSIGSRMINARAETVAEKPAFRAAFRARRCLVPADGFYEWSARSAPRQPYHIAREDGRVFGFAGLWERWEDEAGEDLLTCTLVTTAASETLRPIHHRMPVILSPRDYAAWLDPELGDVPRLQGLLASGDAPALVARAVGTRVNDVRHDDPGCLAPAAPGPSQASLL